MELTGRQIGFRYRVAGQIGSWWRRRAELAQLHKLDERMLKDIGLSPSEIGRLRRAQWP